MFFCFGTFPARTTPSLTRRWTPKRGALAAGRTEWLLLDLQTGKVLEDAAAIDAVIRCEPETPRQCRIAPPTLAEARAKVEGT